MLRLEMDFCKKIETPYNGYNPAIEIYGNQFLYFFRWEKKVCEAPFFVSYGIISDEGEFDKSVSVKTLLSNPKPETNNEYDPKILKIGDNNYLIISIHGAGIIQRHFSIFNRNVHFSSPTKFDAINFQMNFFEKNWVPSKHENEIYLIYNTKPHVILKYNISGCVMKVYETEVNTDWDAKWGFISGGTPPVLLPNGEYITFFHSFNSQNRENNKVPREYFTGAYCFEGKPPFKVTKMTPEPLTWDGLYKTKTQSPHKVIFPNGMVLKNNQLCMSYGENDASSFLCKFKPERILDLMKSI